MQDQNNLSYLKNAAVFTMAWIFGFRTVITLAQLYQTFYNASSANLFKSLFLCTWVLAGFMNAMIYLAMTLVYVGIYYRDSLVDTYRSFSNMLVELDETSDSKLTDEDRRIVRYYGMFSWFTGKVSDGARRMCALLLSFSYVKLVISVFGAANEYAGRFNWMRYMSFIDGLIQKAVSSIMNLLRSFPMVKDMVPAFGTTKRSDWLESPITPDTSHVSKDKAMEIQKKIADDLMKLEQMFGKVGAPMNMPPPDFSNIPPPTEEELKQMNEMMKIFGEMDKIMNPGNQRTIIAQQQQNREQINKILATLPQQSEHPKTD
jgi:hypothetical protein